MSNPPLLNLSRVRSAKMQRAAQGRIQPVAIPNCLSDSCTAPRLRSALFDARRYCGVGSGRRDSTSVHSWTKPRARSRGTGSIPSISQVRR
jgi:hypothetical protein